jgi:hypothetical protein
MRMWGGVKQGHSAKHPYHLISGFVLNQQALQNQIWHKKSWKLQSCIVHQLLTMLINSWNGFVGEQIAIHLGKTLPALCGIRQLMTQFTIQVTFLRVHIPFQSSCQCITDFLRSDREVFCSTTANVATEERNMSMGHRWDKMDRVKVKYSEKNLS